MGAVPTRQKVRASAEAEGWALSVTGDADAFTRGRYRVHVRYSPRSLRARPGWSAGIATATLSHRRPDAGAVVVILSHVAGHDRDKRRTVERWLAAAGYSSDLTAPSRDPRAPE